MVRPMVKVEKIKRWKKDMKMFYGRKKNVSIKELSKLEEAIFNHGGWVTKKYFEVYSTTGEPEMSFDVYLMNMEKRALQTANICWHKMKWRPSEDGYRVKGFNDL